MYQKESIYINQVYSTTYSPYEYFADNYGHKFKRYCIDGTQVSDTKCVGICQYAGHPGCLTEKQRKEHDCINKKCPHYVAKEKRATAYNQNKKTERKTFNFLAEILSLVQNEYSFMRGIKFNSISEDGTGYVIRYFSVTKDYDMEEVESKINKNIFSGIRLAKIKCSYEERIRAIYE